MARRSGEGVDRLLYASEALFAIRAATIGAGCAVRKSVSPRRFHRHQKTVYPAQPFFQALQMLNRNVRVSALVLVVKSAEDVLLPDGIVCAMGPRLVAYER